MEVSVETNRKREREDESSDVLVKRRAVENTQTNDVSVVKTVVTSSEEDQHSHGESDKENSLKDRRIDGNGPVKVITNTSQPVTPMTAAERKLEAEKKRQERDAQREKAAAEKKAKQDEKEKKALEKKQKAEEKQKALESKAAEKEREEKRKEEEKQKKEDDRLKKMSEKEEERRVKEDAKKKKEEERKKKEEEAKQKEEEQRKKVEKQKAISSFFTIKIVPSPAKTVKSEDGMSRWYKPFDTTGKIMPPTRFSSLPQEDIDRQIRAGGADLTVSSKELIEKKSQKERGIKMQKEETETVKVISFDDVPQQNANLQRNKRMKSLRFHDNRRPSYWGTYSKSSKVIRGRRPFAKDETLLDYEVDSDDEWEEEPEDAEDLNKSEDEAEDEAENSEEEDDFVVADGYFSCDEGIQEEGQEGQVSRQKKPIQEEGKGHTVRSTPVVYGVCFELKLDDPNYTLISKMTTRMNVAGPINSAKPFGEVMEVCGGDSVGTSGTPSKRCRRKFDMTEEQIVQIIQMTHGNHNSVANFVSTLSEKLSIPQNIIKQKVKEISIFERRPANPRLCYYVKDEVLAAHKSQDMTPSSFSTTPKKVSKKGEEAEAPTETPLVRQLFPETSNQSVQNVKASHAPTQPEISPTSTGVVPQPTTAPRIVPQPIHTTAMASTQVQLPVTMETTAPRIVPQAVANSEQGRKPTPRIVPQLVSAQTVSPQIVPQPVHTTVVAPRIVPQPVTTTPRIVPQLISAPQASPQPVTTAPRIVPQPVTTTPRIVPQPVLVQTASRIVPQPVAQLNAPRVISHTVTQFAPAPRIVPQSMTQVSTAVPQMLQAISPQSTSTPSLPHISMPTIPPHYNQSNLSNVTMVPPPMSFYDSYLPTMTSSALYTSPLQTPQQMFVQPFVPVGTVPSPIPRLAPRSVIVQTNGGAARKEQ